MLFFNPTTIDAPMQNDTHPLCVHSGLSGQYQHRATMCHVARAVISSHFVSCTGGLDNANRLSERPGRDPPARGCPKWKQEDSQALPPEGGRRQQTKQQRTGPKLCLPLVPCSVGPSGIIGGSIGVDGQTLAPSPFGTHMCERQCTFSSKGPIDRSMHVFLCQRSSVFHEASPRQHNLSLVLS